MDIFNYLSNFIIPFFIGLLIFVGVREKIKVFDIFIEGAEEGLKIIFKLVPTMIGIFFSIELLRCSGVIDYLINIIKPIAQIFNFPSEILPLALIRPISGSGAIGVATDIMRAHGVDSYIGNVAAIIMGSTETTIYTIAVYTGGLKVNNSNRLLIAALTADVAGIIAAVVFCRILSTSFS